MEEKHSPPPFVIDHSDLQLRITYLDEPVTIGVFSHVMSLASPIWKKMVYPPFSKLPNAEAGDDDEQIDFSDDEWEALSILLHIAHLQFNKVPLKPMFKTVLDVAVLCDKYDCVGLVKPWLPLWLSPDRVFHSDPGYDSWPELCIAWVFGKEERFQNVAIHLVKTVETNHDGDCVTSTGEILPNQMVPDIVESILNIRQNTIAVLLTMVYDSVDRLSNNKNTICRERSSTLECDALVYGSLLRSLQGFDMWPRKSPNTVHIELQNLASQLSAITIFTYPDRRCATQHMNCNWTEKKHAIAKVLSSIPDPVLEPHRRHMQIQREK